MKKLFMFQFLLFLGFFWIVWQPSVSYSYTHQCGHSRPTYDELKAQKEARDKAEIAKRLAELQAEIENGHVQTAIL